MSKTEAAKYSLNYFNKQGKAELIKLVSFRFFSLILLNKEYQRLILYSLQIFAVSNVKFEDKYIENLTDSGS